MLRNNFRKIDLINNLSKEIGFSSSYSKKIINELIEIIIQSIKNGDLILKNFGTFKIVSDYFYNLLNDYKISYKADFLNSDTGSLNFYWYNFFNSIPDRDNFYKNWVDSEDSIEIKDLFSEQSTCFSSNSYIGYKVY